MDTLIGTNLGGYTIRRMLGSGGMGAVYLAEDPTIGQQVAIKVVRTDDADYPDETSLLKAAERFRQEARAVASLDHRHILPLYRYGEEGTSSGQRAYMIMQYRPEGSLWDWMRQRAGMVTGASLNIAPRLPVGLGTSWPMGVDEVSNYVLQATSALQHAHEHGLIHRDIKPANFLLRVDTTSAYTGPATVAIPSGSMGYSVSLLLSDFGLAKFFSANSMNSRVFGTPTYMAPEQFEGEARPESDQYSLAVMIYYMLAGRPPFEGDPMRLMHLHCTTEPPGIRQFLPKLPVGVEQTLARALAKQPQQRFSSMVAFADAFMQASHQQPGLASPIVPATPTPQPMPRPMFNKQSEPSFHAASTFTDIAASRQLLRQQDKNIDPNAQKAQASFPPSPITGPKGSTGTSSVGPAGNMPPVSVPMPRTAPTPSNPLPATMTPPRPLANGGWSVAAQQMPPSQPQAQSAPRPVMAQPSQPPQAPIGRRRALGWIIGGTAALALAAGVGTAFLLRQRTEGQVKAILKGHTDTITALNWSPDGTLLASASRDSTARLWSAATQQTTTMYSGHHAPMGAIAWSPDGQRLASGGRDKEVQVWSRAGTTQYVFSGQGVVITALSWLDATHLIEGTAGRGAHVLALADTQFKPRTGTGFVRAILLSPNKQFEAIGFEDGFLSVINLSTRKPQASYLGHKGVLDALAWSPDGTMLASGGSDGVVHIFAAVSGRLVRSLQHAAAVNGVAWDPAGSGRLVAACSDKQLYVWSADGSSSTTYTGHTAAVTALAWHSNGGLASGSQDKTILLWNT